MPAEEFAIMSIPLVTLIIGPLPAMEHALPAHLAATTHPKGRKAAEPYYVDEGCKSRSRAASLP